MIGINGRHAKGVQGQGKTAQIMFREEREGEKGRGREKMVEI